MLKIRVLIVDDSVVIRKILSDELSKDPMIEIAGVAANGRIALQKIPQINPDVITLDIEMPEMDGLETLREIRKVYADLPVIMFSTLTERGGAATLDALAHGASDYVTKPANVGKVSEARQRVRDDLASKIFALCRKAPADAVERIATPVVTSDQPAVIRKPKPVGNQRIEILAIGVSTGGPNALADVIPLLPGDLPVPVLIVQHMPPLFTRLLGERLNGKSELEVKEAEEGDAVEAGRVLIAPGDFHMELALSGTGFVAHMQQGPPENSCRPAVDVLFRSVASHFGANALGVIMTGMGQDGLRGCELFSENGAPVFVQDEETSVVWGMPGFVANAGLADRVLPLDQLAGEISRRVGTKTAARAHP